MTHQQMKELTYRRQFEAYVQEGIRPLLYNLLRTASGEYVSHFTEEAWKTYLRACRDMEQ